MRNRTERYLLLVQFRSGVGAEQQRNSNRTGTIHSLRKFHLDLIPESDASVEVVNPVEIDREDEEGGDAMMLMANDSDLEMLVSLDVLQVVNNRGSNNLNESRLCKGTLFTESSFLYNAYTTHNFIHLDYDAETDLLVTTTTVRI